MKPNCLLPTWPIVLVMIACPLWGLEDSEPLPHADNLSAWLGMKMPEVQETLGLPENMFVHRGQVEEEDNVVFYYPNHFYLFWFQDRVWQVRVDERWQGDVDGLRMGMSREEAHALWGLPINEWDGWPTWTLPDRGFPARVRLYFDEDDNLVDLYVYRSDW